MLKIYELINDSNLVTTIFDDEKEYTVEFNGGSLSPKFIAGQFFSQDAKLQSAIEKDSRYGDVFIAKEIVVEEENIEMQDLKHVDSVINKQLALEWIEQNYEKCLPIRTTIQAIKDYALERGVVFDNL